MQSSRFIVTPVHSNHTPAVQHTEFLAERLNLTPSNSGNVSIFPEDKSQGSFCVDKMSYVQTYPTKSDFCKNILAIQNRSCDHIISRDAFDGTNFRKILSETEGRNQNIVYYRWSGVDDCFGHVSTVYIDKKDKKIYLMPDMNLNLSDATGAAQVKELFQEFQGLGYTLCLPIGSFFQSTPGKQDSQNLQSDGRSCSFLSFQFGQKCDHMNSSAGCGKIKSLASRSLMEIHEIKTSEHGKEFIWKPFHLDISDSDSLENARYLFEHGNTFILPSEFYGTTQRLAPVVLNEFLSKKIFPDQEDSVYNRTTEKQVSRGLWSSYFKFPFEQSSDQKKYKKTVPKVKTISGVESEYKLKTSHIRKAYDLNLVAPENLEASVQIAKDVYAIFKLPPTPAFFEKLGVTLNSPEYRSILEKISPDLFVKVVVSPQTPDLPQPPILTQKTSVQGTAEEGIPNTSTGDDDDIPDMDDFDGRDNLVSDADSAPINPPNSR